MKVIMRKKYVTRGGLPVRILTTRGPDSMFTVVGVINHRELKGWVAHSWRSDGSYFGSNMKHAHDLVEVSDENYPS